MAQAMNERADPLDGREVEIINAILSAVLPAARGGDTDAVDRVIKLLDLKRRFKADRRIEEAK